MSSGRRIADSCPSCRSFCLTGDLLEGAALHALSLLLVPSGCSCVSSALCHLPTPPPRPPQDSDFEINLISEDEEEGGGKGGKGAAAKRHKVEPRRRHEAPVAPPPPRKSPVAKVGG